MFSVSVRYILLKFDEDFFKRFKIFLSLRCHVQGDYFTVVSSAVIIQVHGLKNGSTTSLVCRFLRRKIYMHLSLFMFQNKRNLDAPIILYLSQ